MPRVYTLKDIDQIAQEILDYNTDCRVFLFVGELGAGKTTLIKSMCKCLGYCDTVSSPTFSLINEYPTDLAKIYHMDLYRIKEEDELIDIGLEEYLESGHYCFIEWPQIAEDYYQSPLIKLELKKVDESTRSVDIHTY